MTSIQAESIAECRRILKKPDPRAEAWRGMSHTTRRYLCIAARIDPKNADREWVEICPGHRGRILDGVARLRALCDRLEGVRS